MRVPFYTIGNRWELANFKIQSCDSSFSLGLATFTAGFEILGNCVGESNESQSNCQISIAFRLQVLKYIFKYDLYSCKFFLYGSHFK